MQAIKGIGRDTVAGFFAEVGDLKYYSHPKQIIMLAGLSLKENTSGKHKGQTKITKRGRKKLRALLFRVVMPLVAKDTAFKALQENSLPFTVLVIDELTDLLMVAENSVEDKIQRLSQLARAAGIHMVVATQRPTKQVLSPTIKSNLPVRVAFSVAATSDSMTILDSPGAEDLLGKGDMIYQHNSGRIRLQSAYVSDEEIAKVLKFIRVQNKSV